MKAVWYIIMLIIISGCDIRSEPKVAPSKNSNIRRPSRHEIYHPLHKYYYPQDHYDY